MSSSTLAKIAVVEDGIYVIRYEELMAAGLDLSNLDSSGVRMSSQGTEVPILVSGEGTGLSVIFYGTANPGPYSGSNVCWLDLGADAGKRMAERASPSGSCGDPASSFVDTVRREEDLFYAAKVPEGEPHWYWQKLLAPETATFAVEVLDLAPGEGRLRLAVVGYTSDPVDPDHHLAISFNGCPLAEARWDGQGSHLVEALVPGSCFHEGENLLELGAVADTGARADIVLVDWFEVDHERHFIARDDRLEFQGQQGYHVVSGFRTDAVWLFDVSEPMEVTLIADVTVAGVGPEYELTFCAEEEAGRRYLSVGESGFLRATSVTPIRETADLRSPDNQADYLVITDEDFQAALKPLVEWREEQGLSVEVIGISQVYDQFSYGLVDPGAIRELLRYAHTNWERPAPQYVLLVGEASYDYRDNLGGPNKSLVPTYLVDTAFSGQTLSDNWFVCLDDDVLPDMTIGRLPVSTAAETRAVVDKIIAYERGAPAGDWRERILLVADGAQPSFSQHSDLLAAESVPPGFEVSRVYGGSVEDPRSAILEELRAGSLVVNYVGHGSIDTWSEERLFSSDQISSLGNDGRQPMMILMSCLLGFFGHPERDSMAEELLLAKGGGAVAVFAPSSLTLSSDQGPLNRALLSALLRPEAPTIGEAVLEAKRSLPSDTQGQRDVIETFTLLGDPALRLASPDQ